MPPVKITNVIPTARMPITATLKATLIRFSNERNCGASVVKTIAAARGFDPGPLDDLTRPKGWRAAVVKIEADKATIVQSWNRDD